MEKRWIGFAATIAIGLLSLPGKSQQPAASNISSAAASVKIIPGTLVQLEMSGDIDVKKARAGDIFRARLWNDLRSGDAIILPRKTIFVGHVVDARPRSKDNSESKLTVAIDKAVLKDGSEVPVHGVVERVQLSSFAVALAAERQSRSRSYPSGNPGSTTNIAMPEQLPAPSQADAAGPSNVQDTDILAQPDASGALTVLSSTTKSDVKVKRLATLDVRITRAGE